MAETTLRDTISALVDRSEAGEDLSVDTPAEIPAPATEQPVVEAIAPALGDETESQKADRLRDEAGRFVAGKPPDAKGEALSAPQAQAPVVPHPTRPSSWKKDYWEHWDKIDPKVAEYINQREQEYAKGVSTYKTEWETAKPLIDAIAPFVPTLQQHGIKPDQWISRLGNAHHTLALGSAQEKLQMFSKLAQDYQVPLQALYDPQFAQTFVQQHVQHQPQPAAPDVATLVDQKMSEYMSQQEIASFSAAKDATGNPMYPHFDTVRPKMAQLLEAGLAKDLPGAYTAAVKLDDDLWQSEQTAKAKADEGARIEAQRKAVAAAKGNAVSVRSATPAVGDVKPKGLRSTVADAFEQHTGGRV